MTTIELTALETILGGYGPVDSGTVSATYWAGNEPYLSVVGDEVRFPSEIKVQVIDGATVPLDMVPTRGVCCVRWVVRDHRSGHRLTRYTTIPDVAEIDFGALVTVDPATFEPSESGQAAWDEAVASAQAAVAGAVAARDAAVIARSAAEDAAVVAVDAAAATGGSVAAAEAARDQAVTAASDATGAKVDAEAARDEADAAAERAEAVPAQVDTAMAEQVGTGGEFDTKLNATIGDLVQPVADEVVDIAVAGQDIPGQVAIALAAQAGKIVQGVGVPNGVVTATPGTLYVDTVATMGASVWRKATGAGSTGWVVVAADTGWREISGSLKVPASPGARVLIRREGNQVTLSVDSFSPLSDVAPNTTFLELPVGFDPFSPYRNGGAYEVEKLYTSGRDVRSLRVIPAGSARSFAQWSTSAAWPTALPGTPA